MHNTTIIVNVLTDKIRDLQHEVECYKVAFEQERDISATLQNRVTTLGLENDGLYATLAVLREDVSQLETQLSDSWVSRQHPGAL